MIRYDNEAEWKYLPFKINCSLGDHRKERLSFVRDGTRQECRSMERVKTNYPRQKADVDEKTKELHERERAGEKIEYALSKSSFRTIPSVWGENFVEFTPEMNVVSPSLGVVAFSKMEDFLKDYRTANVFFGRGRAYLHLHKSFSIDENRGVFENKDWFRMKRAFDEKAKIFLILQSVTKDLGKVENQFVLCEVDFQEKDIIFYHIEEHENLLFYADTLWNQFVLPKQQHSWSVCFFRIPNARVETLLLAVCLRMKNEHVDVPILDSLFNATRVRKLLEDF